MCVNVLIICMWVVIIGYISRNMKLGGMGFPQFRVFSMDELYKATDYFHDSTLIGEGSHGKV